MADTAKSPGRRRRFVPYKGRGLAACAPYPCALREARRSRRAKPAAAGPAGDRAHRRRR
jgi:hypothetical protein